MTRKGHGIQLLWLKKPTGIGMDNWRRIKRLLKRHTPIERGVSITYKHSKLDVEKTESLHATSSESYG